MKYLHTMIRVSDPEETLRFFALLGCYGSTAKYSQQSIGARSLVETSRYCRGKEYT